MYTVVLQKRIYMQVDNIYIVYITITYYILLPSGKLT